MNLSTHSGGCVRGVTETIQHVAILNPPPLPTLSLPSDGKCISTPMSAQMDGDGFLELKRSPEPGSVGKTMLCACRRRGRRHPSCLQEPRPPGVQPMPPSGTGCWASMPPLTPFSSTPLHAAQKLPVSCISYPNPNAKAPSSTPSSHHLTPRGPSFSFHAVTYSHAKLQVTLWPIHRFF